MTSFKIYKSAPVQNQTQRNNRIFLAILNGEKFTDIAKSVHLTDSRVRMIAQEMAKVMLRQARQADPSVPMTYSFTGKDFQRDEALWRQRFEVYKAQTVPPPSLRYAR